MCAQALTVRCAKHGANIDHWVPQYGRAEERAVRRVAGEPAGEEAAVRAAERAHARSVKAVGVRADCLPRQLGAVLHVERARLPVESAHECFAVREGAAVVWQEKRAAAREQHRLPRLIRVQRDAVRA